MAAEKRTAEQDELAENFVCDGIRIQSGSRMLLAEKSQEIHHVFALLLIQTPLVLSLTHIFLPRV